VTSIFNGLVPLFAIVIAALVLHDEPITLNRLGGLLVASSARCCWHRPTSGAAKLGGRDDGNSSARSR